ICILNKRARAFMNLFGALGRNQYLEKPVISYDIIHGISLLSRLYRSVNSVFNTISAGPNADPEASSLKLTGLPSMILLDDRTNQARALRWINYLEDELCISGNLENSRGADEESEPSSILIHTTLGRRRCQPQAPLKMPADCLDGRSINECRPTPAP